MGEEDVAPDVKIWGRLLEEQTVLFRKTVDRNAELESRVEELERELAVWKAALKTADDEKKGLNKQIIKLQRNIGSLRDDNPLILCLIDGDGNIFASDLVSLGMEGGRKAAMLLTQGLIDYMASMDVEDALYSRGHKIWLTVYYNKAGLLDAFQQNDICTAEQFEAFVLGFTQASPLFSFVDVGSGKERADEKIKECLRVFTRFPQTARVFFGGAHDNGYISTLNHLQNEGLLNKLVILRGYKELAYELKCLDMPSVSIEGLFLARKLTTIPQSKKQQQQQQLQQQQQQQQPQLSINPAPQANHIVKPNDFEKFRQKSANQTAYYKSPSKSSTPNTKLKKLDRDVPLHKQRPPPCNFYYLAECKHGSKCRYSHDYVLMTDQIEELRVNSKKWPCPFLNRDAPCPFGQSCCMGHACPKGYNCTFLKQGRCKFNGADMHSHSGSGSQGGTETQSSLSVAASVSGSVASRSPMSSDRGLPGDADAA